MNPDNKDPHRSQLGQHFVLLGAGGGHGFEVAKHLASLGHTVTVIDRSVPDEKHHLNINNVKFDLLDFSAMDSFLKSHFEKSSTDSVVFFARARTVKSLAETTSDTWDQDLDICLKVPFFWSRAFLPYLSQKASILFLSSVMARFVGQESPGYHVAKAGLEQLIKVLAVELGARGIRVNGLRIGLAIKGARETALSKYMSDPFFQRMLDLHPVKNSGDSVDISNLIQFFSNPASRFITGTILDLDGGLCLRDPVDILRIASSLAKADES